MVRRPRASQGLSARVVRATLTVGIATVFAAAVVAMITTSNLASERADARDLVAVQLVEDAINERLFAADEVIERTSATAAASKTEMELVSSVASLPAGGGGMFDRMMVVEAGTARSLAGSPDRLSSRQVRALRAYKDAIRGSTGFASFKTEDGEHAIWVTRTTATAWGSPVVVLARLNDDFIERALAAAVRNQPGRLMVLIDSGELAGFAGQRAAPRLEGARWEPAGNGIGRVTFAVASGERYSGFYSDIRGATGIDWRVAAAEPAAADTRASFMTVAPFFMVLVFGGLVGVALAWNVTRQLVKPLKDLERVARAAASGAYVKPLPISETDDEIGRVAQAFNQVTLRLNALHDLSQLLASASRLDQVLDGILSAMGHIVGPGASAVYLLDHERARLVPVRARGIGMSSVSTVDTSTGGWLVEALGSTGPVTYSANPGQLANELPGLASSARSALAAPLVAGHEALGLVVMLRDSEDEVTEAEIEMVRTFSAQAAVAVQTSRLFEIESESRHVAEALRAVAEELVRPATLAASLGIVEEIISDLFGASAARIVIVDRAVLGLAPSTNAGEDDSLVAIAQLHLQPDGATVIVKRGEDFATDRALDDHDGELLMLVPIDFESDHGAALAVFMTEGADTGSMDIARALSDEVALALENAYFYERALARAANLETIFRISQDVASELQVNVVLNRVIEVVQKILSAEAVMLWSYDSRRRTLGTAMVRGVVPAHIVALELEPGQDLPGRVFASRTPVSLPSLSLGMGGVAGSAASQGLNSLLAVPLLARGRSIGVLMVLAEAAGAFSDEDMSIMQTFASQAALAIDTARMYSREHEVAHVLQQSILPKALPDFPEVTTSSVYEPAGLDTDIGGDYYDLFRASDGAIWLAIADVCGKGVEAATKTSMIKYAVRAFVAAGLMPGSVTTEVNRMTAQSGDPSQIVTLWVGRYDVVGGRLSWADGGHPAAILQRADGSLDMLGPTGPLLGAIAEVEFDENEVDFVAGDRLLLYTDGVTEARQGNTFFGEERVTAAMVGGATVEELASRLLAAVQDFVSGELRDDIAILAVEVCSVLGDADKKE
ncbi:MAG: SpoIIE family protein phosphatase [Coriobacteriia bacterium]|nr:SpoIIE family protein phosphatase [Coriobacteriia bacterium]